MSGRTFIKGDADSLGNIPKFLTLTTLAPTYSMKPGDNVLSVISSAADAVAIVTLPSLAEACGQFYFIIAPTGADGGDVTVWEKETGAVFTTYGDMDANGDHFIIFAGPTAWVLIFDGVA